MSHDFVLWNINIWNNKNDTFLGMSSLYETIYSCIIKVQLEQRERLSKAYAGRNPWFRDSYLLLKTNYRHSPLQMARFRFFNFTVVHRDIHSGGSVLGILNLDLFLDHNMWGDPLSWRWAAAGAPDTLMTILFSPSAGHSLAYLTHSSLLQDGLYVRWFWRR